jgi:Endonuclease-reverse transcriptase
MKLVAFWPCIQGPILIMGDFNTHSRSWSCEFEDCRTHRVIDMFEQLNLVHLNDGTHTRIAAPPRRSSAVDLTLCSSDLALKEYTWTVLEDAAGSDHLPILTSFTSLHVPKTHPIPIFDLTRHISWSLYSTAILESINVMPEKNDLERKYNLFLKLIRDSAMASPTRPSYINNRMTTKLRAVWWDTECDFLLDAKLTAFRNFRTNGNSPNYETYKTAERSLINICRKKKTECWRRYCSTFTYETRLSDVWKMAKKIRGTKSTAINNQNPDTWLPGFASKIAPDFVPNLFPIPNEDKQEILRFAQN